MLRNLIESLLQDSDDKNSDMTLMTRDDDDDRTDWENTPFTPTANAQENASGPIGTYTKRGAERLHDELTATRDGQLEDVSTSWFDVESFGYTPSGLYFHEVGPIVATAPGVTWNAAFTMDLDEAPEFKSEAWKDMMGEFQLSKREAEEGTETLIACAYRALEDLTERNDGFRAIHPRVLRSRGPGVKDRYFELAMTCLSECDGVHGPTEGPAWSYIDPEAVDTEATDTEETTA